VPEHDTGAGGPSAAPLLILASASPRRRELLVQLGLPHRVAPADIDERRHAGETVAACVQRLARDKAAVVYARTGRSTGLPVLAADTAVVLGERWFGKPGSESECVAMLGALSARTHCVLTAVCLQTAEGVHEALSASEVQFRALTEPEIRAYWRSGEPCDKAGGYAIQGLAAAFIPMLRGSYSGVMGLPLFETTQLLRAAGIHLAHEASGR
jgi:septum formation protein